MSKYKVFITIKEKSERVKKKNFIKFKKNIPMFKLLLYKLNKFNLFVDTDSNKIINSIKNDKKLSHVKVYARKKKFIQMENKNLSPGPYMIKNFLENFVEDKNEPIIHAHVTSPFLKQETLTDALKYMYKGYDSVTSCNLINKITFIKNKKKIKPINFKFNRQHQKTQNLKSLVIINSAFFIFKKINFLKRLQRISKNNYFYEINFPEYIDIDNDEDVLISKLSKKFL
tara:strand:+ start:228 stop:911 length:684 start_codon:yes stop_codon:yes gene_type:complete